MLASMRPDHGLGNRAGRLFFIGPDVSGGDYREVKGFGDRLILNPQSDPFFGRLQVADPTGLIDPDAKALLLASPTSARNWSRKYSPSRMRGKN